MHTADSCVTLEPLPGGWGARDHFLYISLASNRVFFEHTLQSRDAEIEGSATLFQRAPLQFPAKNYALTPWAITMVRRLKPGWQ
jgi:hypothetical protein